MNKPFSMHTKFKSENTKGTDHFRDLGLDERILLDWKLED
jgi:hypothetical protein